MARYYVLLLAGLLAAALTLMADDRNVAAFNLVLLPTPYRPSGRLTTSVISSSSWSRSSLASASDANPEPSPPPLSSPFLDVDRDDRDIAPKSNLLPPDPKIINNIPRIPSGTFRPKQSLGQNFLVDPNTARRIVSTFKDLVTGVRGASPNSPISPSSPLHHHVIEVGPGAGALTELLHSAFPFPQQLSLIEIDDRAVSLLKQRFPSNSVNIIHRDVLQVDYADFSSAVWSRHSSGALPLPPGSTFGGVCLVGNLPYYLTSQILFSLLDSSHRSPSPSASCPSVLSATVTMQKEVGQRLVALPRTKDYGILSVVFQLYTTPTMLFGLPPTVFYPVPAVDSTLVHIQIKEPRELREQVFRGVLPQHLRRLTKRVFEGRRKTLRNTVSRLMEELQENRGDEDDENDCDGEGEGDEVETHRSSASPPPSLSPTALNFSSLPNRRDKETVFASRPPGLPENWPDKRPEELLPSEFVELTRLVFGDVHSGFFWGGECAGGVENYDLGKRVWRKQKHSRS